MLEAYRDYFRHVIAAHSGDSPAALNSVRLAARLARSNAEASVMRFASEPGARPEQVELLNAILVSSHTFVRVIMALEAGVYRGQTAQIPAQAGAFCDGIEATLAALADSLASHRPLPPDLPDLREAWAAMYPGQTFLEMETDRLITSLNTLKEQVAAYV